MKTNRSQALYMRIFDSTNTYHRWQSFYVNQSVTWDGASWSYHPFVINAFTGSAGAPGSNLSIEIPATKQAVEAFNYGLGLNWLCEVKLYEFDAKLTQAAPPAGQTLIASVIGEIIAVSGSFTLLEVTLGSGLAPIGAQVPPRNYTTALVGTPLKI